jgi:tRNA (guanine-N7-)-methyltransferase
MRTFDPKHLPAPRGYEGFQFPAGFSSFVLEIGAGVGWHAETYARSKPDQYLVAVEHSHERFSKLSRRLARAQLGNIIAIQADAESFVVHCVPSLSLDRILILYPNPYPKAAQANKRWHRMPFMQALLETLKPGGVLQMATNEDFYAAEFFAEMQDVWGLSLVSTERVSRAADPLFSPRTHFEKKYYERGDLLHLMEFAKDR